MKMAVLSQISGSVAEEAGLIAGDQLVSINKQNISSLTHMDLVKAIRKVYTSLELLKGGCALYTY